MGRCSARQRRAKYTYCDNVNVAVLIESGQTKCFARALDWPGWCRAGRTEADALDALDTVRSRYKVVATRAGLTFPSAGVLTVSQRLPGTATTDFGAPGAISVADAQPHEAPALEEWLSLLMAAWDELDEVAAQSSETLRKGPRGGGRDRHGLLAHVLEAEQAYAPKIGVRWKGIDPTDTDARASNRDLAFAALRASSTSTQTTSWPIRYWIHRSAWHSLDHAWEIADKQP